MEWPLDSVILSRRRRISVRGEYDVIGIHAGAWCSPLPADWYLTASYYLLFLPRSFAFVETLQRVSKSAEVGP